MASTYLTRTQTTGNRTTFTWSGWVKKNDTSSSDKFLTSCGTASNFRTQFFFDGSDRLQFYNDDGGSNNMNILTTRVFRDVNAWYHIVLRFDTTQSTASDRIRFYVNGVQETVLTNTTYPTQNADNTQFNYNGVAVDIGRRFYNNTNHWNGSMSHVHFCDGQSYDPDSFGSTDATTGEWKINTSPSVTYGTNGFFILKDGNSVTDQSGNSNNFTVGGGTLTNTEDNPSNVFATLNPLSNPLSEQTLTNGNTSVNGDGNASQSFMASTLEASSGKYYFEAKLLNYSGASRPVIGIGENKNSFQGTIQNAGNNYAVHVVESNYFQSNGASTVSLSTSPTSNDIYMIAYDLDNLKMYFGKNGSWFNSGDPSAGTNGLTIQASGSYAVVTCPNDNGTDVTRNNDWDFNFGNGYFGTTAVASAQNPDDGIGIFEYSVPTGYKSLCTKSINAQEYS